MWNWLDRIKHKNNLGANALRFIYSLGRIEWLWDIINSLIVLFIPILWGPCLRISITLLILFPFCVFFKYICLNYKKHSEYEASRLFRVLDLQSEALSCSAYLIEAVPNWREVIFEKTSEVVCSKIHDLFLSELHINTRVSVEYVEHKNNKDFIVMLGRQSHDRPNLKKVKELSQKERYFIYSIFKDNAVNLNILEKEQIDDRRYWYKNHDIDIKAYWGIAVADDSGKVRFVLQIDFLDDLEMNRNESIKFVKRYLNTFKQMLRCAYWQDLNIKK